MSASEQRNKLLEISKENGSLIARGGGSSEEIEKAVRDFVTKEIAEAVPFLSASEVERVFIDGKKLAWHPNYNREAWCDGEQPLEVVNVWVTKYLHPNVFIGYRCSNPNCRRCRNPYAGLLGHFKILQPNGLDKVGAGLEVEVRRGKKRETEMMLVDEPVFVLALPTK
jgi:hypothetical protein